MIPVATPEPIWLACLCAAWCRTCDGYRPVLSEVAAEFEAAWPGLRVRWIDIEDEADLLGDVDVETFPTLLVADAQGVRFFGPLTPQPQTLRSVLRSVLADPAPPRRREASEVLALAARIVESTRPN